MKELSGDLYVCANLPKPADLGAMVVGNQSWTAELHRLHCQSDGSYVFAGEAPIQVGLVKLGASYVDIYEDFPVELMGSGRQVEQIAIAGIPLNQAFLTFSCDYDHGVGVLYAIGREHKHVFFRWPDDNPKPDSEEERVRAEFLKVMRSLPNRIAKI